MLHLLCQSTIFEVCSAPGASNTVTEQQPLSDRGLDAAIAVLIKRTSVDWPQYIISCTIDNTVCEWKCNDYSCLWKVFIELSHASYGILFPPETVNSVNKIFLKVGAIGKALHPCTAYFCGQGDYPSYILSKVANLSNTCLCFSIAPFPQRLRFTAFLV